MTASTAPGFLENSIASPGIAAMMLALTLRAPELQQ